MIKYFTVLITTATFLASFNTYATDDLIPNEVVHGTNGKVVTGLYYHIQSEYCKRNGDRYLTSNGFHWGGGTTVETKELKNNVSKESYMWTLTNHSGKKVALIQSEECRSEIHSEARDQYLTSMKSSQGEVQKHTRLKPFPKGTYWWNLTLTNTEGYYLQSNGSKEKKLYLTSRFDHPYRAFQTPLSWQDELSFRWIFTPLNYRLDIQIDDLEYEKSYQDLSKLAGEQTCYGTLWSTKNRTSSDVVKTTEVSFCSELEAFWSFEESHERTFFRQKKVSASGGFTAKGFGFKASGSRHEELTTRDFTLEKTEKRTFESINIKEKLDVTVKPNKAVKVQVMCRKINAEIPFTAKIKVRGFADRPRKGRKPMEKEALLDLPAVISLLKYEGYKGTITPLKDNRTVVMTISGRMKLEGAIDGETETIETDL